MRYGISWALAGIFALAPFFAGATALAKTESYTDYVRRLDAVRTSGRVRMVPIGRSLEGREIPMAVLGSGEKAVRVMVLCGQHGDEPVSTRAALEALEQYEDKDSPLHDALKGVSLMIIPMMNPDGVARFTRTNARGADLNRDWQRRSQPETQAIYRAFLKYRPQVVLDAHEWTPSDPYGYNSLESGAAPDSVSRALQGEAVQAAAGLHLPMSATASGPRHDGRLAHRFFGSLGVRSFLLETTPNLSIKARQEMYERIMVRIGQRAARSLPPKSRFYEDLPLPLTSQNTPAPTKKETGGAFYLFGLCGAVLLMALSRTFLNPRPERMENRERSRKPQAAYRRDALTEMDALTSRFERRRHLRHSAQPSTAKKPVTVPARPKPTPAYGAYATTGSPGKTPARSARETPVARGPRRPEPRRAFALSET